MNRSISRKAKGLAIAATLFAANVWAGAALAEPAETPADGVSQRQLTVVGASQAATTAPTIVSGGQVVPVNLSYDLFSHTPYGDLHVANPSQTVFRAGQQFYLQISANQTGIYDVYNIEPDGEVKTIGSWTADSTMPVRVPGQGKYIAFTGQTGTDQLVVKFYPCRPDWQAAGNPALTACSQVQGRSVGRSVEARDLAVVPNPGDTQVTYNATTVTIPLTHSY